MNKEEIFYRLLDDGSEGEVATVVIDIPGATVMVMGDCDMWAMPRRGACTRLDLTASCACSDAKRP